MAIPFLNNINLSDNQLLNAKLQVTSTAPTAAVGQIYFDSTAADETAKYYSNATDAWVSLKEYTFPAVAKADGYITSTITGTTPKPIVKFNLNATGTADDTKYLRGDNQWEPISGIPGTYTWSIDSDTGSPAAVASGDTIDFAGGTNVTTALSGTTLTINSTDQFVGTLTGIGAGTYISVDNSTPAVPIVNALGTEAATPSKLVARDSSGYGYVVTPASGDSTTKIATTAFVQSSLTGLLEFKGGFNASTGAIVGGGNLTSGGTRVAIEVGDYYVVTVAGDFFGNTATPLTPGDSVIVQTAAVAGASVEGDFIVVQSDTDLATLTTVGIGNVNIYGAGDKDGLSLAYASGTATVGLDITGLPSFSINPISGADLLSLEIPLYNGDSSDANEKIEVATLLSAASSQTSFAATITDTATITHNLGTKDVIIQLFDTATAETVYADVVRASTTTATITFAATPTNSIRVLVQKIG